MVVETLRKQRLYNSEPSILEPGLEEAKQSKKNIQGHLAILARIPQSKYHLNQSQSRTHLKLQSYSQSA